MTYKDKALEIIDRLKFNGYVNNRERGVLRRALLEDRPTGKWEALGFQQGYAFCRCSNCHKTMRLYRDSTNEFTCIADIRKNCIACIYCGARMEADND